MDARWVILIKGWQGQTLTNPTRQEPAWEEVITFWFVDCRPAQWFRRDLQLDTQIRNRFGERCQQAQSGELSSWEEHNNSALALVLLLDQFSRHVWRGQAQAFAGDERALRLSQKALDQGWIDAQPNRAKRQFWLMPMLHCESASVLEDSIPLLERYADAATAAVARKNLDLVRRFGRFPHRNAALGRRNSSAELDELNRRSGAAIRPANNVPCAPPQRPAADPHG